MRRAGYSFSTAAVQPVSQPVGATERLCMCLVTTESAELQHQQDLPTPPPPPPLLCDIVELLVTRLPDPRSPRKLLQTKL